MPFLLPKTHGVLGINARNFKYLKPFNPSKAVAFADDKLKTKVFLETRGIPVPKLYAKITNRDDLRNFDFESLPESCVLKPNFGYGGEGIVVIKGREQGGFKKASGGHISYQELFEHIEDILDGMYSLHHRRDTAFFEQIIEQDPCFAPLNPAGLPDIRIIVHNLVPVMAMMRLPTVESEGKANVHLGGIALGIDIAKGVTTFAVQRNERIERLPDGKDPAGFKVPHWDEMLLISSRIQQITNIGFLGVDLTINRGSGPMLLEVNARPGLMIQIANLAPLGRRLERVAGLKVSSPEKGVRMAQDLFGEKLAEKSEEVKDGKPVLGTEETIEILGGKKTVKVPVVLRPDHEQTVFDPTLLSELQKLGALEEADDGAYHVKFVLGGKKMQTLVRPHEIEEEGFRGSLGKRDLKDFLVDPGKRMEKSNIRTSVDLIRLDKQLGDIDRKLQLLKHIRPLNLEEERAKTEEDASYNPVFTYGELSFEASDLLDRLQYLEADSSPLGQLLEKKRVELIAKIHLLSARGNNQAFTKCSEELFGKPMPALVKEARAYLQSWDKKSKAVEEEMLTAEQVKAEFESVLTSYGLRDWGVKLKSSSISDVSLGKNTVFVREGAVFSRERLQSLIAHEIETHVLTAENAHRQPYELFDRCAGYLETQEGLAIYNQNRVLSDGNEKRYWPAMGTLAVHYGLTHSFAELRAYIRRLGFDDARALRTCFKVKRGMGNTAEDGAFTKELVYYRGWRIVQEYLEDDGDMRLLYKGKINLRDVDLVRAVEELIDPVYIPKAK